jgi:hypothetical protein
MIADKSVPIRSRSHAAKLLFFTLVSILWCSSEFSAFALRSVTLGWNPNPGSSVSGYNVYALEENGLLPIKTNVGLNSQATIPGLKEGLTYRFTVTAYNQLGLESPPSAPISYFVPVPLQIVRPTGTSKNVRLRFPTSPGRQYQLQASSDLKTWTNLWQTSGGLLYSQADYEDLRSGSLKSQFYRVRIQ